MIHLYKWKAVIVRGELMDHIFNFKMSVLSEEPSGGLILSMDHVPVSKKLNPFISGKGALNYSCGKCNHLILRSIRRIQIQDAVYKCPKCGAFNRINI